MEQVPGTPTRANRHLLPGQDRKSTRLNSSHLVISYAVFCLKKKTSVCDKYPGTYRGLIFGQRLLWWESAHQASSSSQISPTGPVPRIPGRAAINVIEEPRAC